MEILNWNASRRVGPYRLHISFYSGDEPLASFSYDTDPAPGVRPYHLLVFQFPCAHFFSPSSALAKALLRVFDEPDTPGLRKSAAR
jgi:hypothetical protein